MLQNKLGITDEAELAREEERISKKKAAEMFENGYLDRLTPGTFQTLAAIHRYLFSGIYDFAGQLRTVNLAKGTFRFAPVMYLDAALTDRTRDREVYMKGIDRSYYYEGYFTYKTAEL